MRRTAVATFASVLVWAGPAASQDAASSAPAVSFGEGRTIEKKLSGALDQWTVTSGVAVTMEARSKFIASATPEIKYAIGKFNLSEDKAVQVSSAATFEYLDASLVEGKKVNYETVLWNKAGQSQGAITLTKLGIGVIREFPRLVIESNVPDALLHINGSAVARTVGDTYLVPAGRLLIMMSKPGLTPCSRNVMARPNAPNRVTCMFALAAAR